MSKLLKKIRFLRNKLVELVEVKGDLLDPEVLNVSKQLDIVLNEYNKLKYIYNETLDDAANF